MSDTGPTLDSLIAFKHEFPSDWVSPIFGGSTPVLAGTAALIGRDLFLTAAHAFEAAFATSGGAVHLFPTSTPRQAGQIVPVTEWERHPDSGVDIVVGRFKGWHAEPPFLAIAHPTLSQDLMCIGYPVALELRSGGEPETIGYSPRFLKGHETRPVDPPYFGVTAPSFECSFALARGMSGSPIYYLLPDNTRALVGIAVRNLESHTAEFESIHQRVDEPAERVVRVVEYAIGVRLSALLDWEIALADGLTLGKLIAPRSPYLFPSTDRGKGADNPKRHPKNPEHLPARGCAIGRCFFAVSGFRCSRGRVVPRASK